MEYICFSEGSLSSELATRIFNSNRLSFAKAGDSRFTAKTGLICNGTIVEDQSQLFALFGTVFLSGGFFNNFSPRSDAKTIELCKRIQSQTGAATGTYTGLVIDKTSGDVEFLIDDMNASPCFVARHRGHFAVSNNVHMLAGWLEALGVSPTRSIEPFLSHTVFSSGLTTGSLFREIHTVRAQERPAIKNNNLSLIDNTPVWPDLLHLRYDEIIFELAKRIRARLQALSNLGSYENRVIDITGGMDSRIIMAGLVGARLEASWHFNTYFSVPNPDAIFAQYAGEKWGLRQMDLASGTEGRLGPMTTTRYELFAAMGSELKGGPQPHLIWPDLLHVHGGFGELGGKCQDSARFTAQVGSTANTLALSQLYLNAAKLKVGEMGFSDTIMEWAVPQIADEVERSMSALTHYGQMPPVFYRRGKARSHYGIGSHLRQLKAPGPDVLADPYLTAAAIKAPVKQRILGRVNFDIIRMLGGDEIVSLPLAKAQWKRELFEKDSDFRKYNAAPMHMDSEPLVRVMSTPQPAPTLLIAPLNEHLWAEQHPKIAISLSQLKVANLRGIRIAGLIDQARALLNESDISHEVVEFLTAASVQKLIELAPEKCGDDPALLTTLQFFCQAEMWMREMEQAPFPA